MKNKWNWFSKYKQEKREKKLRMLHSTPETSYNIIHRIPKVGDTTTTYDYNEILELYNNADLLAIEKIESGIKVDQYSGKFLKQDIEIRCLMLKALLVEWRERHRNARISIDEEKLAYKKQLELELMELEKKYDELMGGK